MGRGANSAEDRFKALTEAGQPCMPTVLPKDPAKLSSAAVPTAFLAGAGHAGGCPEITPRNAQGLIAVPKSCCGL
jgi:hypothetical protein